MLREKIYQFLSEFKLSEVKDLSFDFLISWGLLKSYESIFGQLFHWGAAIFTTVLAGCILYVLQKTILQEMAKRINKYFGWENKTKK